MTKFGINQIGNDTPGWAKWAFRVWFFVSKAFIGWLGYTHLLPKEYLYEVIGIVSLLLDPILYGISKMFGIHLKDNEYEK